MLRSAEAMRRPSLLMFHDCRIQSSTEALGEIIGYLQSRLFQVLPNQFQAKLNRSRLSRVLAIAPAVPDTFLHDAESGFVRIGLLSCGHHSSCNIRVLFE